MSAYNSHLWKIPISIGMRKCAATMSRLWEHDVPAPQTSLALQDVSAIKKRKKNNTQHQMPSYCAPHMPSVLDWMSPLKVCRNFALIRDSIFMEDSLLCPICLHNTVHNWLRDLRLLPIVWQIAESSPFCIEMILRLFLALRLRRLHHISDINRSKKCQKNRHNDDHFPDQLWHLCLAFCLHYACTQSRGPMTERKVQRVPRVRHPKIFFIAQLAFGKVKKCRRPRMPSMN